jgi:hypothetical protein
MDPEDAARVAAELMRIDDSGRRLQAATISAKEGNPAGQQVLLAMLESERESLGYRGMAARRLGSVRSAEAHPVIVALAIRQTDRMNRGDREPDDVGFLWSLLKALGHYRTAEDLPVALNLFHATGLRGPVRAIGVFGSPQSLPWLREALSQQAMAWEIIDTQLAIARSGGEEGAAFVRALLQQGARLKVIEGSIDMRTEDPLSGRLADHLLRDLGAHSSDRQFFGDVLEMQRSARSAFWETAWGAVARMGTAGHEAEVVEIAATFGRGQCDPALRALAFNGAAESARDLGRRLEVERSANAYIDMHAQNRDRDWFSVVADGWD